MFNWFSGQTLYDAYLYQLFNLFYASMPIVVYAVFDEEYSSSFLDKAPQAYKQGMLGTFNLFISYKIITSKKVPFSPERYFGSDGCL